ncbi:MAG TPA: amino acid permease, partial [Vicinamibacterales bacterium]|nr:amino acid permease [Vicinamibacterales bacterium]
MLPPSTDAGLQRGLGPLDAAAIVISNVIGGGIFFVPVIVAQLVPQPGAMLAVWIAGGALAFAGAMAYAELAAARPHAGGEYVYLRDAYGPLAAFLTGWTSFIAGFSGAIAASAVALAGYVGRFVPLGPAERSIVALTAIAALTFVHVRGLGPGRLVQNVLAGLKVSAIVALVALGFAIGRGHAANFAAGGELAATSWFLALIPVMFSYSGWNAAAYVAEEVRDPARNVPLSLAIGTIAVILVYVALNALYVFTVPVTELATLPAGRLMDTVAERLFGFAAGNLLAIFT